MGSTRRVLSTSYFHPSYQSDEQPCYKVDTEMFSWEYYGSGIAPSEHPLKDELGLERRSCLNCESHHILVIYAQRTIHPMSGDEYYDLEVVCQDCGKFSVYAFADND